MLSERHEIKEIIPGDIGMEPGMVSGLNEIMGEAEGEEMEPGAVSGLDETSQKREELSMANGIIYGGDEMMGRIGGLSGELSRSHAVYGPEMDSGALAQAGETGKAGAGGLARAVPESASFRIYNPELGAFGGDRERGERALMEKIGCIADAFREAFQELTQELPKEERILKNGFAGVFQPLAGGWPDAEAMGRAEFYEVCASIAEGAALAEGPEGRAAGKDTEGGLAVAIEYVDCAEGFQEGGEELMAFAEGFHAGGAAGREKLMDCLKGLPDAYDTRSFPSPGVKFKLRFRHAGEGADGADLAAIGREPDKGRSPGLDTERGAGPGVLIKFLIINARAEEERINLIKLNSSSSGAPAGRIRGAIFRALRGFAVFCSASSSSGSSSVSSSFSSSASSSDALGSAILPASFAAAASLPGNTEGGDPRGLLHGDARAWPEFCGGARKARARRVLAARGFAFDFRGLFRSRVSAKAACAGACDVKEAGACAEGLLKAGNEGGEGDIKPAPQAMEDKGAGADRGEEEIGAACRVLEEDCRDAGGIEINGETLEADRREESLEPEGGYYRRAGKIFYFTNCRGGEEAVSAALVEYWREVFRDLDVDGELAGIAVWLKSNYAGGAKGGPMPGRGYMEKYVANCLREAARSRRGKRINGKGGGAAPAVREGRAAAELEALYKRALAARSRSAREEGR